MIIQKGKETLVCRTLSSVTLLGIFGLSIIWIPLLQYFILPIIAVLMFSEWYNITNSSKIYLLLGLIIIPITIISLMLICEVAKNHWIIITYIAIITSVDVFAMFGGILLGGPKLAPKLSPKKTWSGLLVGVIAAGIITNLLTLFPGYSIPENMLRHLTLGSFILAFLAQMSDLFESYFKRRFNFKDSGTIIPGHGGVLDRLDSYIFTAPVVLVLLLMN